MIKQLAQYKDKFRPSDYSQIETYYKIVNNLNNYIKNLIADIQTKAEKAQKHRDVERLKCIEKEADNLKTVNEWVTPWAETVIEQRDYLCKKAIIMSIAEQFKEVMQPLTTEGQAAQFEKLLDDVARKSEEYRRMNDESENE